MIIDDSIVRSYLAEEPAEGYCGHWIYQSEDRGSLFETPDPGCAGWVEKLRDRFAQEIGAYEPRDRAAIEAVFPCFDEAARDLTVILAVGFCAPYQAMMLERANGEPVMVLDLIRFGERALEPGFGCGRMLTHELIHVCLHRENPQPESPSHCEAMDYIAFDEGFAHAFSYAEDMDAFRFDGEMEARYRAAQSALRAALCERDPERQRAQRIAADTGAYWDKFGAIAGKLYLLKRKGEMGALYRAGWRGFARKIAGDAQ